MKIRSDLIHYIKHPLSKDLSKPGRGLACALTALASVASLGILPGLWLIQRHFKKTEAPTTADQSREVSAKTHIAVQPIFDFKIEENLGDLSRENFPEKLQELMIDRYYSKPLPNKEDVLVPVPRDLLSNPTTDDKFEWKAWNSLSREDKIKVNNHFAHKHTQVPEDAPEKLVDAYFFNREHHDVEHKFLPKDPRAHHGSDHCVRATLFAPAFAYLYAKYHPDYRDVSQADILLSQFAAAAHDCARASEGTDVYDMESAERAVNTLRSELGVKDKKVLDTCRKALENKDGNCNDIDKSLVAKCLQNADCADFARLHLKGPEQGPKTFANSRKFLDIYNEIKELTQPADPDEVAVHLNHGRSFDDFTKDLDTLRTEMNRFIYETHTKAAREKFSESDNYYKAMLSEVTSTKYPMFHGILADLGIITES